MPGILGLLRNPIMMLCLGASLPPMVLEPVVLKEAALATGTEAGCTAGVRGHAVMADGTIRPALARGSRHRGDADRCERVSAGTPTTGSAEASASTVLLATTVSLVTITALLSWFR